MPDVFPLGTSDVPIVQRLAAVLRTSSQSQAWFSTYLGLISNATWTQAKCLAKSFVTHVAESNDSNNEDVTNLIEIVTEYVSNPRCLLLQCKLCITEAINWDMNKIWLLPLPRSVQAYLRGTDAAQSFLVDCSD